MGAASEGDATLEPERILLEGRVLDQNPPQKKVHQHVLLVEDEDMIRHALAVQIERWGYRVTAVSDGIEALEILESDPEVDVVLTDNSMPRMSGVQLAREIWMTGRGVPVLLMAGDLPTLPPNEVDELFSDVLEKPVWGDAVQNSLRACLRRR